MWDRDASSRDDFMGKATVAIGGLMDWKPRLEWVALKDKDVVVGKVQLSMVMEKKTANSEAPLQVDLTILSGRELGAGDAQDDLAQRVEGRCTRGGRKGKCRALGRVFVSCSVFCVASRPCIAESPLYC